MSLLRRTRSELDWPEWSPARRLLDRPEFWRGLWEAEDALRVEEFQDGDTLVVRAEMPGIDPDRDVEITVANHLLRVKAERRQETKTEDKKGYRSEFRYGSFTRTLPLPAGATEDDVKAGYSDGILEVRIPIDGPAAEAKKIPVEKA
jgi:HSP20 family protein